MANTGASINMLNRIFIENLKAVKLHPTQVKVYRFNSKELVESRGKFEMMLESNLKVEFDVLCCNLLCHAQEGYRMLISRKHWSETGRGYIPFEYKC